MLIHGTIGEIPLKWAWVSSCKLRREMEHRTLASYLAGQTYLSFTYAVHWVQSLVATLFKLQHSLLQLTSSRLPWTELSSTLRWIIKKCKTSEREAQRGGKSLPVEGREPALSLLTSTLSSRAFLLLTPPICQQGLVILLHCPVVYTESGLFYRVLLMDWINGNAI